MSGGWWCCICFLGIPSLLTIVVMIPLALKNYTPHCYLQDLYVPALNTKLTANPNSTANFIFFDLKLPNGVDSEGVRYRYYNSTFSIYYTGFPIANYTAPKVSQGDDEITHLHDVVETLGMPWKDASGAVSNGSVAAFTVELATTVRVHKDIGGSRTKVMLLRARVEVNASGERVKNKAIRLVPFNPASNSS